MWEVQKLVGFAWEYVLFLRQESGAGGTDYVNARLDRQRIVCTGLGRPELLFGCYKEKDGCCSHMHGI